MTIRTGVSGVQGNDTYMNPIIAGDYADPTIVRVGEHYYMTHSCFEFAPGFLIWHSTDLVNWQPISRALTEYVGNIWAPDITYYEGKFYIYAPIDEEIMVLTAADVRGPWTAPVKVGIRGIDPGHVVDDEGNRYLFYSSGYCVKLTDDGLTAIGEAYKVYEGWNFPDEWVVEGRFLESPKLTYHNGYFYLTVAQGGSSGPATSHMVASARAKTPWGPYEDSPHNPIIRTESRKERWLSRGHGSIIDTVNGEWWIVYHAYEKGYYTLGRQTLLEPLQWTEDGWFCRREGVNVEKPIAKPHGLMAAPAASAAAETANNNQAASAEHNLNAASQAAASVEFATESGELGYAWSWYMPRGPIDYTSSKSVISFPNGQNSLPLVMMPQHHYYEAKVEIDISEQGSGRFVMFYNDQTYSGIELSSEGLHGIIRGWRTPAKKWASSKLFVKLQYVEHEVVFYCSHNGTEWSKFEHSFETSGWHHNALGGFLALRLAVWAQGAGKVSFSNFEYRPLSETEAL